MANAEQLAIWQEGPEFWNEWRAKNRDVEIDLSEVVLAAGEYSLFVEFAEFNLSGCNLRGIYLDHGYLLRSDLRGADLSHANLIGVVLKGSNLVGADLYKANLSGSDLTGCLLTETNLSGANLQETSLVEADLVGAEFAGCNFLRAEMGATVFGNSDMSQAIGLENVVHRGPSRISIDVFARSKGKIPDVFLWGCGLSDWEIEAVKLYNPELSNDEVNKILYKLYDFRASQALQISPLFISYSHTDGDFVDKLGDHLKRKGVRYWRDIHDATAGRLEKVIDRAMRLNPTVLLILSAHSLKSDWVEHEVREARKLEKEIGRDVLCPVALDDDWKSSSWPKRIMEQVMEYHILDFSAWKDDIKFSSMFRNLIDGLRLFYRE